MGVQLVNNIPKVIPELKRQVAIRINNAADFWVDTAMRDAPVLTMFLRSHIGQTVLAVPERLEAEVRSLAPYSGFVNFGTSKQSAQPYWTNAFIATRNRFKEFFYSDAPSAGHHIISRAMEDYGKYTVTRIKAIGGGVMVRGPNGKFSHVAGRNKTNLGFRL